MKNYKSDEEFEIYLKAFQPLPPAPLPAKRTFRWAFPRFPLRIAIYSTAISLLVATAIVSHVKVPSPRRPKQTEGRPFQKATIAAPAIATPLTLQKVNLQLASEVSYGVAIEGLAFPARGEAFPPGRQHAFAVLAEQKGLR